MIRVIFNKKTIHFLSSWDEFKAHHWNSYYQLVPQQLQRLFETSEKGFETEIKIKSINLYEDIHFLLLCLISDLTPKQFLKLPHSLIFQLIEEFQLTAFMFQVPNMKEIPLPKIKYLVAPTFGFQSISTAEFAYLDSFYRAFKETSDPDQYEYFLAILYREPSENPVVDQDNRIPFNKYHIDHRLKVVRNLPKHVFYTPLIWFELERNKLPQLYPILFNSGDSSSPTDWLQSILSMSGGKFGTFKETERTPIRYYLSEMARIKQEQLDLIDSYNETQSVH